MRHSLEIDALKGILRLIEALALKAPALPSKVMIAILVAFSKVIGLQEMAKLVGTSIGESHLEFLREWFELHESLNMGMPYCLGGEILRCAILSPFHLLPPIVAELLGSLVVSTMDVTARLAAKEQMLLVKIKKHQLLVSLSLIHI